MSKWYQVMLLVLAVGIASVAIIMVAMRDTLTNEQMTWAGAVIAVVVGVGTFLTLIPRQSQDNLTPEQRNRRQLIQNVRRNWVGLRDEDGNITHYGFLYDALRDVPLEIGLKPTPTHAANAAGYEESIPELESFNVSWLGQINPLRFLRRDQQPQLVANTSQSIKRIFHDVDEQLLILGKPASGKTILMLQLAERLLEEAERDPIQRIPLVFNLTSWAAKQPDDLTDWLREEMRQQFSVPDKSARKLIQDNKLIYLLDGLDEVAEAHRAACVTAINAFMKPSNAPKQPVVICSRTEEYEALSERVGTHNAIQLLPLEQDQFATYLKHGGVSEHVATNLMSIITANDAIWQQSRKPLFANILIDTYRDRTRVKQPEATDPLAQIHELIIAPYVARQLSAASDKPCTDAQANQWLNWLGWQMRERELTVFYVEMLQSDWLVDTGSAKWLANSNLFILILVFSFTGGIPLALIFGSNAALLFGVAFGWINCRGDINVERKLYFRPKDDILIGTTSITHRATTNQGLRDTTILGISAFVTFSLMSAGLFVINVGWQVGLGLGVLNGLSMAMIGGLSDVFRHTHLRAWLALQRYAPWLYAHFLHYVIRRRLMRQVGGGVMFAHRYLLDYFATQYEQSRHRD